MARRGARLVPSVPLVRLWVWLEIGSESGYGSAHGRQPDLHGWTAYTHKDGWDVDKCGFFSSLRGSASPMLERSVKTATVPSHVSDNSFLVGGDGASVSCNVQASIDFRSVGETTALTVY